MGKQDDLIGEKDRENVALRQQLQAAMNTIEALKRRVVDLNFQIVDQMSGSIAAQQQAQEQAMLAAVPDEEAETG